MVACDGNFTIETILYIYLLQSHVNISAIVSELYSIIVLSHRFTVISLFA